MERSLAGTTPDPRADQAAPVDRLLAQWRGGDAAALHELIPIVHDELERIARRCLASERRPHPLDPLELVNEAYLRLVEVRRMNWRDGRHFLAMSARLMRRILVDQARSRGTRKRGSGADVTALDEHVSASCVAPPEHAALHDARASLATFDSRQARVVELRYFAGLGVEETASALGVSAETVMRDSRSAKSWLSRELRRPAGRAQGVSPDTRTNGRFRPAFAPLS